MRMLRSVALLFVLGALAAAACTNPVSPAAHMRIDQFMILAGEDTLVHGDRLTYSDTLRLGPGQLLAPVRVVFLRQGVARDFGDDYFLQLRIEPAGVAAFEPATEGAFTGALRGVSSGEANLTVRLMHGRFGSPFAHSDFDGAAVPVLVAAQEFDDE
jgi:hypothetical protein